MAAGGAAGREMRPNPLVRRVARPPHGNLLSTVVHNRLAAATGDAPQRPIFAKVPTHRGKWLKPVTPTTAKMTASRGMSNDKRRDEIRQDS